MTGQFALTLANCRNFRELAQAATEANLYDHDFTGCLIAEISEDGRIREVGRFGISGPGPSAESVPMWDEGLIAKALKSALPTEIVDPLAAAKERRLTPGSDIDELVILNGFQTVVAIPLRSNGLLTGVIGLCSVSRPDHKLVFQGDFQEFQALMALATRSIGYLNCVGKSKRESPSLTPRERAVLGFLESGDSNKEIAGKLKLSQATIKLTVSSILAKLNVPSREAAVQKAAELGL